VLAALERHGAATLLDLRRDFPKLAPSAVLRVFDALGRRGLVKRRGPAARVYLGGVLFWPATAADESPDEDEIDWGKPLPEPARTALRRQIHVMTALALIRVSAEELAGAGRNPSAAERSLKRIDEACDSIGGDATWLGAALGVPRDLDRVAI
jgi:hypothetical protein